MSEAESGSDLASIRSEARWTGKSWRIHGRKMWSSNAQYCRYMIALLRSSGSRADRQNGLSQFIVDLRSPGVRVEPIVDMTGQAHFCEVVFEDVECGPQSLIGREGEGWSQVVQELAYERSGPERLYSSLVLFDQWLVHLRSCKSISPASRRRLGTIVGRLAVLRAMSIAATQRLLDEGEAPLEAALVKDLGTELEQAIPHIIADDLGEEPAAMVSSELNQTLLAVSRLAPSFSIRGGTREVLRGIVARGLGLR